MVVPKFAKHAAKAAAPASRRVTPSPQLKQVPLRAPSSKAEMLDVGETSVVSRADS